MNTMQLPTRVIEVLAALKTQGFTMKVKSMEDGDIMIDIYKDGEYQTDMFLREKLEFDMYDTTYEKICKLIDPRVQRRSAAILKYLEGIIEY